MLLSIIIPVYNAEKNIVSLLTSIKKQLSEETEVILINDGSTDNTERLISQFKSEQIRIYNVKNGGVSKARNLGVKLACGEYICFIDSDDSIPTNYIENVLTHISPKVDLVVFGVIQITQNNKDCYYFDAFCDYINPLSKNPQFFCHYFLNSPWNKVYKRKIIQKYNLRFNEISSFGEDMEFNLDYLKCVTGKIKTSRSLNYIYVIDNINSLSNITDNYNVNLEYGRLLKLREILDLNDGSVEKNWFFYLENKIIYMLRLSLKNLENVNVARSVIELRNKQFDLDRSLPDKLFLIFIKISPKLILLFIMRNYSFFSSLFLKLKRYDK